MKVPNEGSMPESPACEQQSNDNCKPRRQPLHRAPHRLRPARRHPNAATQASCENLAASKRTQVCCVCEASPTSCAVCPRWGRDQHMSLALVMRYYIFIRDLNIYEGRHGVAQPGAVILAS